MGPGSLRRRGARPARVVGIGLSDGGVSALQELLSALPPRTGMAYVVVQALDHGRQDRLDQALAASPMPVLAAKDGAPLAADRVYVLPHGQDAGISAGRLALRPRPEKAKDGPIDAFFSALARELKDAAVGVVLAGGGRDGAKGAAAIRAGGGATLAQDPATAQAPSMPAAAVSTGAVDFVLTPRLIAEELSAAGRAPDAAASGSPAGRDPIAAIVAAVRSVTGADFSGYKRTTLVRRVRRRMAARRTKDLAAYAARLAKSPAEARALHDEILIHVTSFFREPEAFQALEGAVFEPLVRGRARQKPIRLWVPGCSTGEEVYSLAIALCEFLEKKGLTFPLQIFGTDLSEKVVAFARRATYAAEDVPSRHRRKYFSAVEEGRFQVSKTLREMCVFAAHDLTRDPPFSNMDLVSCRNVLIYFDQPLQERVIPIFHYALAPSGFLMLGSSESIDAFKALFAPVDKTGRVFGKKPAAGRLPLDLLTVGRPVSAPPKKARAAAEPEWSVADLEKEADRIVLSSAAPGIIVSADLDIIQFRGDVAPFLSPTPGKAGYSLGKAAHAGLLSPLSRAVEQAAKRRVPIVIPRVEIARGGAARTVQLQVIPLSGAAAQEHFLILFADPAAPAPEGAESLQPGRETRERGLERELQATRRSLEAVIEKQQTTNEELQSANEELRSRNEEYQSSIEELQTTYEELQSANEELATLNEELRKRTAEVDEKNGQLTAAYDELRAAQKTRAWLAAIVDSSDDAIISKDLDGVITSWNRGAERLFGFTAAEAVGKPITIVIPDDRLEEEPRILARMRRGERIDHFETVRRRKDGALVDVSLTISPVRADDGALVGISKIARDVTERKRAADRLERTVAQRTLELRASNAELEAFCYAVAHDLRAPLRSINGFAQLVQRRIGSSPDVAKDFQRIIDNSHRMGELIDGLLTLSRLTRQDVRMERVDLSALAAAAARDLRGQHPERDPAVVIQPGAVVTGDADLLRALMQNLLDNAWKFTSKVAPARIEFGVEGGGPEPVYYVRDNGAGFDGKFAASLFNPFHRLHHASEFPGTGIGLATVKRIVTRHNGRIWAEGAVGRGATFRFTLAGPGKKEAPAP